MAATELQLNKLRTFENGPFESIYKKFEQIYHGDPKKMSSLQTFKAFGKNISTRDIQFKKKMQQFHMKLQREFLSASIIRIQYFFSSYIKKIDNKIHCCEADIQHIRKIQHQVINMCSLQRSAFHQQRLINTDRLKSMGNIFENEIKTYEKTLVELKKIKSEGILQLSEDQLQISKVGRSLYQLSDAEMHEKQEWRSSFFERITL